MTIEEIDKYCELCMDVNCTGCEFQDVHFRNVPWYKANYNCSMTRHEQRLQAADKYIDKRLAENLVRTGDTFKAFLEGAKWADEHPDPSFLNKFIDQVAKWLVKHDVMNESFVNTFMSTFKQVMINN